MSMSKKVAPETTRPCRAKAGGCSIALCIRQTSAQAIAKNPALSGGRCAGGKINHPALWLPHPWNPTTIHRQILSGRSWRSKSNHVNVTRRDATQCSMLPLSCWPAATSGQSSTPIAVGTVAGLAGSPGCTVRRCFVRCRAKGAHRTMRPVRVSSGG